VNRRDAGERHPSHPTAFAPATVRIHKAARRKLGSSQMVQMVRQEDLGQGTPQ